jgi:DNA polymerase III alpha subunit (gram-positive type)
MKYISLDIETTGLDRENDQVLEIGAIFEDTNKQLSFEEIPKFHAILNHPRYSGTPFAIDLNQRIFKILAGRTFLKDDEQVAYDDKFNIVRAINVSMEFYKWLYNTTKTSNMYGEPIKIIVAGKNVASFDIPFLENIPNWNHSRIKFGHRVIDPAMLYIDFNSDLSVPSLETCLERAEFSPNVTHNAIEDAWDVIKVLRKKY